MNQFPVHPSTSLSVCRGINYKTTEEPHYTERGTEREREREREREETGISKGESDLFATDILNIIVPDRTSRRRN